MVLALAAGVSAFAPTTKPARASVGVKGVEDYIGADVETAGLWDPFGFMNNCDEATMYRRRCAEIKNGRVAQMATIGMVMGDLYTFPGYLAKFSSEVGYELLKKRPKIKAKKGLFTPSLTSFHFFQTHTHTHTHTRRLSFPTCLRGSEP